MATTTTPLPETVECGACERTVPFVELFSHPCDTVPQWLADRTGGAFRVATSRGDNVDAPERRESTGRRTDRPAQAPRTNRYAGQCTRCGQRVEAEEGVLVRNHAGGSGGAATWDVVHQPGECATPAAARPVVDTPDITAEPEVADARRCNRYGGKCVRCGEWIDAEAGKLVKTAAGWGVDHPAGPCPIVEAPAAAVEPAGPAYVPEKGEVHVVDGEFYRVQMGQRSRRFYAVRWVPTLEKFDMQHGVTPAGGEWEYAEGMLRRLSADTVAGVEEAARFGAEYRRCVFCTQPLDLAESQAAGYGQTCAAKRGLPWG